MLSHISTKTQQSWVNRYESGWLKDVLINAIDHHITKEKALSASQINDWGARLTGWVRREKKPRLVNPGVFSTASSFTPEDYRAIFGDEPEQHDELSNEETQQ